MEKILIANRGEIAIRVMRSARELGIKTVAIFSEADRSAQHVKMADEAVCVGPAKSADSYLNIDTIIREALRLKVDGVHPGYGFLSENAEFVRRVEEAGMIFIGPGIEAIELMGSKLAAKEAVKKYDVPMVPGLDKAIEDIDAAKKVTSEIGFPVLIKASAGGGGKGMRVVESAGEFESQMKLAVSEATSSFGDGSVFVEKYVGSPRHIEIQVLADKHGNVVHLFERECSIQRRHQKVVEEAPSAVATEDLRKRMGQSAVDVAKSCNYVGAGTVEFLLDEKGDYYFLEMNTRLQVEHPVTEMITGIDLVKEQIKIARGEKLSFAQEDLTINGHAIELRVYAEDPLNGFLPSTGIIDTYLTPKGPGVRVDDGFESGQEVSVFYDPMIAKLVVHGETRVEAIERMKRAISEYQITGVETTLSFGDFVMNHEAFTSGDFNTHFVKNYYHPELLNNESGNEQLAAAISVYLLQTKQKISSEKSPDNQVSGWRSRSSQE